MCAFVCVCACVRAFVCAWKSPVSASPNYTITLVPRPPGTTGTSPGTAPPAFSKTPLALLHSGDSADRAAACGHSGATPHHPGFAGLHAARGHTARSLHAVPLDLGTRAHCKPGSLFKTRGGLGGWDGGVGGGGGRKSRAVEERFGRSGLGSVGCWGWGAGVCVCVCVCVCVRARARSVE